MMHLRTIILYTLITVLSIFDFCPAATAQSLSAVSQTSYAQELEKLEKEIQDKEARIKELEEKAAVYQKNLEEKKAEANTLINKIYTLDNQIGKLDTEIGTVETKIEETKLIIEKLTLEINTKQSELEVLKKRIAVILRMIQDYDEIGLFETVLTVKSFSEIFTAAEANQTLQEEMQKKLEGLKILKTTLEEKKAEFDSKETDLEDLKDDLSYKKIIVGKERQTKKEVLNVTKGQEKQFNKLLQQTEAEQEQIQKDIEAIESKKRSLIDPAKVPGVKKGLFSWPAEGVITQGYGSTSITGFKNPVYSFHNGIDIAASTGTPIKSPYDGKVVASGTNGKYAYGNWIAIDHQNGLTTLYGHLSAKKVAVGNVVKKGQVIGYMGSTGFSTGPHLHFTVYASNTFSTTSKWYGLLPSGGSLNPMNYL